jgi:hypothetical protein
MKNMFCKKISEYKALETSYTTELTRPIFEFNMAFSTQCSHAGFSFCFCFWKFNAEFNIYDVRHWNHEENRYESEEETKIAEMDKF